MKRGDDQICTTVWKAPRTARAGSRGGTLERARKTLERLPGEEGCTLAEIYEELDRAAEDLRAHRRSMESIFAQIEKRDASSAPRIAKARQEQERLESAVMALRDEVGGGGTLAEELGKLIAAIQRHERCVSQLVFDAWWRDVGVGD